MSTNNNNNTEDYNHVRSQFHAHNSDEGDDPVARIGRFQNQVEEAKAQLAHY